MTRDYVVLVDQRENTPLLFPAYLPTLRDTGVPSKRNATTVRLATKTKTLAAGDYALEGYEDVALVERKGSLREIFANVLSEDRTRFVKALDRLASSCRYPLLLLEGDPFQIMQPTKWQECPGYAIDGLFRLLVERRISWCIVSTNTLTRRRAVGELVVRHLLAASLAPTAYNPGEPGPEVRDGSDDIQSPDGE